MNTWCGEGTIPNTTTTKANTVCYLNQSLAQHRIRRVICNLNWKVTWVNSVHDEGNKSCSPSKRNHLKRSGRRRTKRRKEETPVETWHLLEEEPAEWTCMDSFTAQREGIAQKASLALLNFLGGSLGWEGKAQKLRSGFWGPRGGVCELTGIERLRNLAEEEERPV